MIARLREKPTDVSDNKPDDENYLTTGTIDVLYDQENNTYKAKSVNTVAEAAGIEETDRMRHHQTKLLKAVEQYETEVGRKYIKLSTGISLTSQHNWNDVVVEVEVLREKYRSQEGSDSTSTLENLCTYGFAPSGIEDWLALLPSTAPCASRLCGGMRTVFAVSITPYQYRIQLNFHARLSGGPEDCPMKLTMR
jgi:hypothetical protein